MTQTWNEWVFDVNGFPITARYTEENINEIFRPFLQKLTEMQKASGRRLIVFLAAPPATGKSTLVNFLSWYSANDPELTDVQSVGLDGFHYHQDYILTHDAVQPDGSVLPMKKVKGSPETYDVAYFIDKARELRDESHVTLWPEYSRKLHDVIEDRIPVTGKIVLVEGNWLLFQDERWGSVRDLADYTVFISAKEESLRGRLIERKMKGGLTREEAEEFYRTGDGVNVRRTLAGSSDGDLTLLLDSEGVFHRKKA